MNKIVTLGIVSILTLSLAGCNSFQATEPKDAQPTAADQSATVVESNSGNQETSETASANPSDQVETLVQFDTLQEYIDLILDDTTSNNYKTTKPANFVRVTFNGDENSFNVAPDGVSAKIYVLAKSNWNVGNMEDVDPFYLEVVGPSPCWGEADCNEPNTVDYYGPFQGKVKTLVQ